MVYSYGYAVYKKSFTMLYSKIEQQWLMAIIFFRIICSTDFECSQEKEIIDIRYKEYVADSHLFTVYMCTVKIIICINICIQKYVQF